MKGRTNMNHELLFLGTCARDFSPRLEGECRDCFDLDARRSSSALVDGRYLIDCGTHTLESLRIAGIDRGAITDLFVTHLHSDHFDRENIAALAEGRDEPLRVWVREGAEHGLPDTVSVSYMTPFTRYEIAKGLSLTGMPANHDAKATPQHLLLDLDGKRLLYACDGAWMLNETYYFLKNAELSVAVLDCTTGDYLGDFRMGEHNSIPMLRLMLPSMRTWGILSDESRVYLSHIAPSLHKPHVETAEIVSAFGATLAHDGMRIAF